uniref:DDE Tnp4 domain-containing protein n=1 Tax=Lactuca sativa TaxID=4236 RepID=A0A9R1UGI4_LACSA|nr:hypothetical protein LSAT_V11C900455460 [Lactuca sativa]
MMFTFVVTGWEGIAHDSRILSEALTNPHAPFPLPPSDKYYLSDAAYANIRGFMAPYHNVRRERLRDEYFSRYDELNVSVRNNNAVFDDDEDEISTHSIAADHEYMTQLRDEIVEQLMQNME